MTAVEWLESILNKNGFVTDQEIEQAKEMEKQQIKDAFQYKFLHPYVENEPEKYYNETYKPSA
jgi:vacuolar-type H+-ATPase subunit H